MTTKTKKAIKSLKATAKDVAGKAKVAAKRSVKTVQKAAQKGMTNAKAAAKKTVRKASAKVTQSKKTGGFIQNVKDSIHTGMEAMGDVLKKITPNALLPDSAKSK